MEINNEPILAISQIYVSLVGPYFGLKQELITSQLFVLQQVQLRSRWVLISIDKLPVLLVLPVLAALSDDESKVRLKPFDLDNVVNWTNMEFLVET